MREIKEFAAAYKNCSMMYALCYIHVPGGHNCVLDYGLIAGVCVIVMNFHSLILQLFRFKFFGVYYTVQKKFLSVSKQRH